MQRAMILGCGARAHSHACVYPEVAGMELVACCDLDETRARAFADEFSIPEVHTDFDTALAKVRPDVVHVVTNPTRRVAEAEAAAAAGVRAIVLEKPIAVRPGELRALAEIEQRTGLHLLTNSQRRYFPEAVSGELHEIIHERLGDLYFVRCSTRGNLMGMGPHLMDWLLCFLNEARPEAVWAMGHGRTDEGYQRTHIAPEHLLAEYWFPGNIRVVFDCDPLAVGTPGDARGFNCHLEFHGTQGRLSVMQLASYWVQTEGMAEPVRHEADADNHNLGQRELTRGVVALLEEGVPHRTRLQIEQPVFEALFAAEQSVYEGRRIDLPSDFSDDDWESLMRRLAAG
jgi:predicted dehydrogenase